MNAVNDFTPVVHLENVSIYQGEALILSNVNLEIHRGEFVYLIGKTGSGKSSLLKTLYGDLPLDEGHGTVAGIELKGMKWNKLPDLRRKLGIIFQDFNLLTDRTVADNLKFVLKATGWKDKKKIQARTDEVLNMVGLPEKGHKMPFALSGGEQQRIVVARALLNNPELILADEPTGNLDPNTSDEILQLIKKLSDETHTPVLMATHDYMMLEKFPARIIRCGNGTLADTEHILK